MARRQSTFEDLMEIASRLPWFVGVGLALLSYFICHAYANSTETAHGQLGKALAMFLQALLPIAFSAGALASFIRRRRRHAVFQLATDHGSVGIDRMSWREFEVLIGESFRRRGYAVVETGGNGADGGYDLILKKDGERFLVQCKQWRSRQVGVSVVRELCGVMSAENAQGGFVVSSGSFTRGAMDFADESDIGLIDGRDLAKLFAEKYEIEPSSAPAPACPRCGSEMVRREARRGASAGQAFWGCRRFPACRVTQSID
jgi:restriction system protein